MCPQPVPLNLRRSLCLLVGPSHLPPSPHPDLSSQHAQPHSEEVVLSTFCSAAPITITAVWLHAVCNPFTELVTKRFTLRLSLVTCSQEASLEIRGFRGGDPEQDWMEWAGAGGGEGLGSWYRKETEGDTRGLEGSTGKAAGVQPQEKPPGDDLEPVYLTKGWGKQGSDPPIPIWGQFRVTPGGSYQPHKEPALHESPESPQWGTTAFSIRSAGNVWTGRPVVSATKTRDVCRAWWTYTGTKSQPGELHALISSISTDLVLLLQ